MADRVTTAFDKYDSEILPQSIDWVDDLLPGESITGGEVIVYDKNRKVVTGKIVETAASVNTTKVEYTLHQGTPGEVYWVYVNATLNTTEVLTHRLRMSIPLP